MHSTSGRAGLKECGDDGANPVEHRAASYRGAFEEPCMKQKVGVAM